MVVFELGEQTHRQTDRQTDRLTGILIAIFRTPPQKIVLLYARV